MSVVGLALAMAFEPTLRRFYPGKSTRDSGPAAPASRAEWRATPIGNAIFLFGGQTDSNLTVGRNLYRFDGPTAAWETRAQCNDYMQRSVLTTDGTYLYMFKASAAYKYDPSLNTYTRINSFSGAANRSSGDYYPPGNCIYIAQGTTPQYHRYDIAANTMTTLSPSGSGVGFDAIMGFHYLPKTGLFYARYGRVRFNPSSLTITTVDLDSKSDDVSDVSWAVSAIHPDGYIVVGGDSTVYVVIIETMMAYSTLKYDGVGNSVTRPMHPAVCYFPYDGKFYVIGGKRVNADTFYSRVDRFKIVPSLADDPAFKTLKSWLAVE